jgi:acetyl esterase/lipase
MMVRMKLSVSTFDSRWIKVLLTGICCLALSTVASAQKTVVPLWPQGNPEPAQTTQPEADITKPNDGLIDGRRTARLTNVTRPTVSVYLPHGQGTGTAALVFPGGGYSILAWNGEGTDTCDWLNSIGVTCLLVKYRVPEQGRYPDNPADLEDAQQAMRLARTHAAEWHIDPNHIGVVGFSAGGNLAALLCTHPDDNHIAGTPAASQADVKVDARPNFAILVYPAYLNADEAFTALDPVYTPNQFTPPTFLIAAENDRSYGKNALLYFRGLIDANVPAELHFYATGGHGFGAAPVRGPEQHWTDTATTWLRSIHMLPPETKSRAQSSGPDSGGAPAQMPCSTATASQPPQPGNPNTTKQTPQNSQSTLPCW